MTNCLSTGGSPHRFLKQKQVPQNGELAFLICQSERSSSAFSRILFRTSLSTVILLFSLNGFTLASLPKLRRFLFSPFGKIALALLLYVAEFALIGGIMMISDSAFAQDSALFPPIILFLVFGIFGWKTLAAIQPSMFLFPPIVGWLLYFFIKGFLSLIVGIFAAPIQVARAIREKL